MAKAVALLSGGLDSFLAVIMVQMQGIDVTALTFLTSFGCDPSDTSSRCKNPFPVADKFGFDVRFCTLTDQFIEIVKNPAFGYGKHMNPCIDCRILMLREAKKFMSLTGADFIITGEVLGQRPMSQRRDTFHIIDRESGLKGYVLRPLSAKLLPETAPEKKGLVERHMLCGFSGRSRKPQMRLAEELGLTDYPAPAGGCLLTEPNYAYRLRELLDHNADPTLKDLSLLKVGRHFRVSPTNTIVIGRNMGENEKILSLAGREDYLLKVEGFGSPFTLLSGKGSSEHICLSASLCARYSDAKHLPEVEVTVIRGGDASLFTENVRRTNAGLSPPGGGHLHMVIVAPASNEIAEHYRIDKRREKMVRGTAT
jgi:tRNA-uridine 2-sulfurtransferase